MQCHVSTINKENHRSRSIDLLDLKPLYSKVLWSKSRISLKSVTVMYFGMFCVFHGRRELSSLTWIIIKAEVDVDTIRTVWKLWNDLTLSSSWRLRRKTETLLETIKLKMKTVGTFGLAAKETCHLESRRINIGGQVDAYLIVAISYRNVRGIVTCNFMQEVVW